MFSQNGQNGKPSLWNPSRKYSLRSEVVCPGTLDNRAPRLWQGVESVIEHVVEMDVVVVHAPHTVAAVAADIDVFDSWLEDERIKWQVRLEETAVSLCDDAWELYLERR